MVDLYEIDRLVAEFEKKLTQLAGTQADVNVWFHGSYGDNRSLAHDACDCGYSARRTPFHANSNIISHITVSRKFGKIRICVKPRKAVTA